ncbi:hypothetical protein HNY73_016031 [Argiope bruennichi]|uniref:Uncharacterized protein n=1 Tax=Argiope bruennichi TaxID=94029 RepID=A0A8T0EHS1_ARGBR|nr:hypothetical protein HNY73_016031 [Argiope bruennichi]
MGVSKIVILRLKKAAESGNALKKHAGGRGRNTTLLEDRYVALVAERNRNLTPGQIAANLVAGMHVSARTISQRLNQVETMLCPKKHCDTVKIDTASTRPTVAAMIVSTSNGALQTQFPLI